MYYHLKPHVYVAIFNENIIVLDLKKNQYVVLSDNATNCLVYSLTQDQTHLPSSNIHILLNDYDITLKELQSRDYLTKETLITKQFLFVPKNKRIGGASNIDWRLLEDDLKGKTSILLTLEAWITLAKVYLRMSFIGFYSSIKSIKKCVRKTRQYNTPAKVDLTRLTEALNKAAFYFPKRVKCLEWSLALAKMCLKREYRCNIEIGVQNIPFMAHAWVLTKNGVVADDVALPDYLSVILSEPFKKL